jgi:transcriptional regulator with XRE-family HTH domain
VLKNLKRLREERGISQQKLADEFGLSQQSINKYENHKIEPEIEIMQKFADYFETSIDYLVGHTEIRHKIEPVEKFDLNNEEAILVEKYRELPIKFRASISSLLDDLLSKN